MKPALSLLLLLLCGVVPPLAGGPAHAADDLLFDGVAQPSRVLHLGAATDGLLVEVLAERGDRVSAGQVLARLDATVDEAEARLAEARAQADAKRRMVLARLEDVRRRLESKEALREDGFVSDDELDSLRTELHLEELNLVKDTEDGLVDRLESERARAIVAQAEVRSPIDGVVLERLLSPGELLSRSGASEVLTLARLDPLFVELHVPVDLYDEVAVGDGATVLLDAPGAPERRAQVAVKDATVDTASRTFRLRLELPNPDHRLPAGLRCRVRLDD